MDYNVALLPTEDTKQKLVDLSAAIESRVGTQLRLREDSAVPHLTVYLAGFPTANQEAIAAQLKHIADRHRSAAGLAAGWTLTRRGLIMLSCDLDDDARSLHANVVAAMNPLRRGTVACIWERSRDDLDAAQSALLDTVGFPYALGLWRPHFTIAKIDPGLLDDLRPLLDAWADGFLCSEIGLGLVGEHGAVREVIVSYELQ